jgi:hypothetical protein
MKPSEALAALDEALALVQNVHAVYLAAEPEERRMLNQAIFSQLLVRTDLLEGEEAPIFSQIRSLGSASTPTSADRHKNQDPRLSGGLGYNMTKMVRMRGLEPPRTYIHTDLNRARLPIPPHPRGGEDEDIVRGAGCSRTSRGGQAGRPAARCAVARSASLDLLLRRHRLGD